MTLFGFAHRTSPLMLYALPALAVVGAAFQIIDGQVYPGIIYGMAMLLLWCVYLLKTAQHMRTIDRLNAKAYVRRIIHNANEGLPAEQVAVDYVAWMYDNPIA